MNFRELTEDLLQVSETYGSRYNIDRSADWHVMKIAEESGELMQSYLKFTGQARLGDSTEESRRQAFADEIADVICMTLLLARETGVDVEQAIERKWLKYLENPTSVKPSIPDSPEGK